MILLPEFQRESRTSGVACFIGCYPKMFELMARLHTMKEVREIRVASVGQCDPSHVHQQMKDRGARANGSPTILYWSEIFADINENHCCLQEFLIGSDSCFVCLPNQYLHYLTIVQAMAIGIMKIPVSVIDQKTSLVLV